MKKFSFYLSLLYVLGSCASFKEVKAFAINSQKSIESYKSIDYSFSGNCNYKCSQRELENDVFQTTEKECACKEAQLADKNVSRLLNALKNYFKGLSNLSNSNLTDFSYDAVEKPLVEGKYFSKAAMKPYSSIVGLTTKMFSDQYRARKLEKLIEVANADIILLLDKTVTIVQDNLLPTLSSRNVEMQQIYHDLYNAPEVSDFEKFTIQKMYFAELTLVEDKKAALNFFSNSIEKISKGHQSLYDNKDKLKDKNIEKIMHKVVNDLSDIEKQIKK